MKKNVASQVVGVQMISATDGSAFTGSVTVHVTGDGGTQATGSVGSGACTHEGNGFHTYAPAQAETNYDHVAFTFTGTGAIPATVQVYPSFPQTGDAFARIGAPVGASISADVAAVKTQTAAIETDTQDIQTRLPAALVSGRMDSSTGAMASGVLTATAIAADAITAAKLAADVTTELQSGLATASALSTVASNVTDILADTADMQPKLGTPAGASVSADIAAVKSQTAAIETDTQDIQGRLPAALVGGRIDATVDGTGLEAGAAAVIADAVWDELQSGHTTGGTFGEIATEIAAILVDTAEIGAAGAGLTEAGGTGDHLTAVPWNAAWDAEVQSEVQDAIEANHLDHLLAVTYDPASKPGAADALLNELVESDSGVARFTANALEQGPSGSGPSAADIADAVWTEAVADHSGVSGSTAEALAAAGGAGDPWITALPGSYSAGQAGYILGTNLNATVSSRATQTSVDTIDDLLDTEVAAIKTVVDAIEVDTQDIQSRLPAALVSGRIDATVDGTGLEAGAAAVIADAVWDEAQSGHVGAGTFGEVATEVAAILVDTAEIGAAGAGLTAVPWNAAWDAEVQSECADALNAYDPPTRAELTSDTSSVLSAVGDVPTNSELATALAAADDAVLAAIAALNNLSAAQVNAEVVDALATDTYAEPGQGSPAATASIATKLGFLYKAWRNRSTQTSSEYALYADDGTTKDQEAAVSDDGTTLVRSEVQTGA